MTSPRLEQLNRFLEEDPGDPFTHYAIAMEYVKMKSFREAVGKLEEIILIEPHYVPAYHQLGLIHLELNNINEARVILQRGIRTAGEVGDSHAGAEMEEVLEGLK